MLPDYIAYLVCLERNKDMLREAQRERLARLALAGRERHDRFFCWALTWLGHRLVAWGQSLQERYSAVGDVPLLPTIDHTPCRAGC
jgi:hypothetical protein